MIVRKLRWGYDGGGMACGPVEGTYIAELAVTGGDGRNYFIAGSRLAEFGRVEIAEVPLFDLTMEQNHWDVDFDYEQEKRRKLVLESYDFEMTEDGYSDRTMFSSRFAPAIRLSLRALEQYCSAETDDDAPAEEFIWEYIGADISRLEPLPKEQYAASEM